MRRRTFLTLTVVVALLGGLAIGAAAAENETTTPTETPEPDGGYQLGTDEEVVVEHYEWNGTTLTVEIHADTDKEAVITDASREIDGFVDIRQQYVDLDEGTQTFKFDVYAEEQRAVTIATRDGIAGIGEQDYQPDRDPIPFGTVIWLILGTTVGTGVLTYRAVDSMMDDDEPEVERIL